MNQQYNNNRNYNNQNWQAIQKQKEEQCKALSLWVGQEMDAKKNQLMELLPKEMKLEEFKRLGTIAMLKSPDLVRANKVLLWDCFLTAARMGIMIDNKESYAVMMKNKPVLIWTKYAIIKKLTQTGLVDITGTDIVHENDHFKYWKSENGKKKNIEHEFNVKNSGDIIGAYAYLYLKDGHTYVEYMNRQELNMAMASSPSKEKTTWKRWFSEMGRKTIYKRMAKELTWCEPVTEMCRQDDSVIEEFGNQNNDGPIETENLSNYLGNLEEDSSQIKVIDAPIEDTAPPETEQTTTTTKETNHVKDEFVEEFLKDNAW